MRRVGLNDQTWTQWIPSRFRVGLYSVTTSNARAGGKAGGVVQSAVLAMPTPRLAIPVTTRDLHLGTPIYVNCAWTGPRNDRLLVFRSAE